MAFPHHLVVQEGMGEDTQLCIVVVGSLIEILFINISTTHAANGSMYPSATGKLARNLEC